MTDKMMCPACGHTPPEGAGFCNKCGASLPSAVEDRHAGGQSGGPARPVGSAEPKKDDFNPLIGVAIFVASVLFIGSIIYLRHCKDGDQVSQQAIPDLKTMTASVMAKAVDCAPSSTGKGGPMCLVPSGKFQMGCNSAVDSECVENENPYHEVTLSAYKIDRYEVTATEYKACVTSGGCTVADTGGNCNYGVSGKENHPINCVDWNQAKAYCMWAGKRLPTEAEWEKAARGTDGRKYAWGNDPLDCNRAVHSVSPCSNTGTAAVGSKPSGVSPYGAEDMIGNVFEWVEDDHHGSYSGAPSNGKEWIDNPRGTVRVVRGGAWSYSNGGNLRASKRTYPTPSGKFGDLGFRCAQ